MLRFATCSKIAVSAALLAVSMPSAHTQAPLYKVIIKVVAGGVPTIYTLYLGTSWAKAWEAKENHPGAKIETVGGRRDKTTK